MTREEAIKILDLNAGRLSNSVQMAIATLIRETSLPSDSDVEEAAEKEYPCDKSWMTEDMLDLNAHKQVAFRKGAEWQKAKMLRIAKNRYEMAMTFVTGNMEVDHAIQLDRLGLVKIIQKPEDSK